jgi:hypothetical protein
MQHKGDIIWLAIGIVLLLAGICIVISPLDKVVRYEASSTIEDSGGNVSSVELNPTQWEQFKTDLFNDKIDITQVKYIDSGDNKLVQFQDIPVDINFPFGVVTPVIGKRTNSAPVIIETLCFIVGGITVFFSGASWELADY